MLVLRVTGICATEARDAELGRRTEEEEEEEPSRRFAVVVVVVVVAVVVVEAVGAVSISSMSSSIVFQRAGDG